MDRLSARPSLQGPPPRGLQLFESGCIQITYWLARTKLARGLNTCLQRLQEGDARLTILDVLLNLGAVLYREFAVEIFRKPFEDLQARLRGEWTRLTVFMLGGAHAEAFPTVVR